MSKIDLHYEKYNNKSLAVRGNKAMYHDLINGIGGRWNPRMKDEPGWLLTIDKEPALKKLIDSLQRSSKLDNIASHSKSRKGQSKYHRALSESENEEEDEEEEEDEDEVEEEDEPSPPKRVQPKRKAKKSSQNVFISLQNALEDEYLNCESELSEEEYV